VSSLTVDVSVVMAVLDAEKTIAVQLEALARQEFDEPWELVVADNGCTDGTLAIVESYRSRIERLRVVPARGRRGAGHALNVGVREARGGRLLFCDADDEVAPGWVQAMAAALKRAAFVTSKHTVEELNEPWVVEARGQSLMLDGPMVLPFSPHLPIGPTAGMGVRRTVHESVGGFDEDVRTIPDTDYCIRVQQQTEARLEFVPEAIVHYRYRTELRAIFRQANRYAHDFALLQRRYAAGRPGFARWVLKHWRPVLGSLPRVYRRGARGRLAWLLGYQLGRYRGSVRYRVRAT
jgi:glycosyltransferase involved in cell wall biosynthesis